VSVPTTHLVTHAAASFVPGHAYVLLSFARSGNSPESVASYRLARRVEPSLRQMVITCNQEGALAEEARNDDGALCVVLPEETNDRSLVMTSSFSNMALAGVGLTLLKSPRRLLALADRLAEGGERILRAGDTLAEFAGLPFARACFLGSNALCGTMQECHLKMQEMTEGRVASRFESFLGLRHGPQVFVNGECVVVAALSSDAAVRRYELDMLRELKAKRQGCGVLAVCDRATSEIRAACTHAVELYPEGEAVEDGYRVMTDVMVGQILGVFKSLAVGLKPDNPSTSGTINRVVQGVTIYEDAARGTGNAEGQREHERRDEGAR
jgi:tagatose-6-phosphate ketose/aldose isomerase